MSTFSSSADPLKRPSRVATAIACVALLVVPLVAWLLVPTSQPPPRVVRAPTEAAPPPVVDPSPHDLGPTHPAAVAPAPRPIQVAPAEQAVKGTVVDPDGHAVEGATVVCKTNGTSVTTDASGHFAFGSNAVGCEAVAQLEGFAPSETQQLAAGDDNELRLQKGGSIHGVVVDDGGAPVRSFTLSIELFAPAGSSDYGSLAGKTKSASDPGGAFTWDGLAAGTYVLAASAQGHGMGKSDRIAVEMGKTTGDVRIQLAKATSVSGKVTDADTKQPVEGATVTLDGEAQFGGATPPEATTDKSGAFTLDGVPAGRFSVRVSDPEYRTVVAPGDASGDQHASLEVTLHKSAAGAGYEMLGVGLFVGGGPKGLWVFGLMPGSPAEKAGIQSGDLLLAIDGVPTDKMTVGEANNRLRGPEGTVVHVRYSHAGAEADATLTCAHVVH